MSEQQMHQAVVQHVRQRGVPGLVFLHPPNGGYRRLAEARIFSSMGVRPGAADLLLWHDGQAFALELKAPGGRASEAQLAFLAEMERAGAHCALAEGLDRALATLEAWGLLKGQGVMSREQLILEIIETQTTRDHVTDDGVFLQLPAGSGWRVLDSYRSRYTTWTRRRPVAGLSGDSVKRSAPCAPQEKCTTWTRSRLIPLGGRP
jgi:hypothetical protein